MLYGAQLLSAGACFISLVPSLGVVLVPGHESRECMHELVDGLQVFGLLLAANKDDEVKYKVLETLLMSLFLMLDWLLPFEDVCNRMSWVPDPPTLARLKDTKEKGLRFALFCAQVNQRTVRPGLGISQLLVLGLACPPGPSVRSPRKAMELFFVQWNYFLVCPFGCTFFCSMELFCCP